MCYVVVFHVKLPWLYAPYVTGEFGSGFTTVIPRREGRKKGANPLAVYELAFVCRDKFRARFSAVLV